MVTDEAGGVLQQLFYSPFGRRIGANGDPVTGAGGSVRLGFTGHEHDDELGLVNMRGRMYDPKLRRFLTPDPVVGTHPYSHVGNNPLRYVDPSGYWAGTATARGSRMALLVPRGSTTCSAPTREP